MSDINDPAEAIHRHVPFPELPDEDVDPDAVRRDVARDDEVLRALAAVLLPEPAQVTRIDVDVENGVDTRVEGRFRDRIPPVRPRPVDHDHFPRGFCSLPIRTTIFVSAFLNSGSWFKTPIASRTRGSFGSSVFNVSSITRRPISSHGLWIAIRGIPSSRASLGS